MKKPKLPKTDSIQKLAEFWDKHDLTDFEDELEEVAEPVFARRDGGMRQAINVPLKHAEATALQRLARAKGISREQLLRRLVLQEIARARA
jgi:hypothetical protein